MRALLPFLLAALLFAAFPALAQSGSGSSSNNSDLFSAFSKRNDEKEKKPAINQYSDRYKKHFGQEENLPGQGLLPQENFQVSFVDAQVSDDAVLLRLSAPASVSGCASLSAPTYEASEQGDTLMIKVAGPVVELQKTPRYDQFDCKQSARAATIDIPLSRARIERAPIRKIAFRSTNQTDYYAVELQGERLRLIPQSQVAFRPRVSADGADPLVHWFFPENTIALYAPAAPAGGAIDPQIRDLANAQGLVPLSEMLPGFTGRPGWNYYVDLDGAYARPADATGKPVYFGSVETPQGRRLDVYARTPYLPG